MKEAKIDQIRVLADDHGQRISSLEVFSNDASQCLQDLETLCASLQEANSRLTAKVADLEGRTRRSNLRILGLPESTESGRPTQFFSELLIEVFGKDILPNPPEIDRVHRSLMTRPMGGERLHPVYTVHASISDKRSPSPRSSQEAPDVLPRLQHLHSGGLQPRRATPADQIQGRYG